jgi:rare lipoprotein A
VTYRRPTVMGRMSLIRTTRPIAEPGPSGDRARVWNPGSARHRIESTGLALFLMAGIVSGAAVVLTSDAQAAAGNAPHHSASPRQASSSAKSKVDLSGHKRVGKASFYGKKFSGRKMADGTKMNPHRDNAASKTLPLGTTAKVTNLETGQSAEVTIQDRGPHVKGRIVDLSPFTAKKIGIAREDGVADVKVVPIAVPQPDGSVKSGAAAQGADAGKGSSADRGD